MAQAYYSPISINSGQVPSTQTDFPVLVSVTDARFKTIGNGGHVSNANGYDIRPYTDTTLGTAITGYELERYNGSTGEVIMWVKVASLSSSTTPIVLGYGDTGITTDGSSTTTWSNSYLGVYLLKDGTTLSVASSTGSNNGSNVNGVTATAGKINGGGSFASASSQYIGLGTGMNPTALTYTAWVNATSLPNAYNSVVVRNVLNSTFTGIWVKSNGKLLMGAVANNARTYDGTGSNTLSTGTTYHLALTYDSTAGLVGYVNASSDNTVAANGALSTTAATSEIGHDFVNTRLWNGMIDHVTIASVARSANWLTTEYNNQNAPGTFETLGTEVALSTNTGNFFLLFP